MRPFVHDDGLGFGSLNFLIVGVLYDSRFLVYFGVFAFFGLLSRAGLFIFDGDLLLLLLELVDWEGR